MCARGKSCHYVSTPALSPLLRQWDTTLDFSKSSVDAHEFKCNPETIYLRIYDPKNDDTCADKSCLWGGRRLLYKKVFRPAFKNSQSDHCSQFRNLQTWQKITHAKSPTMEPAHFYHISTILWVTSVFWQKRSTCLWNIGFSLIFCIFYQPVNFEWLRSRSHVSNKSREWENSILVPSMLWINGWPS